MQFSTALDEHGWGHIAGTEQPSENQGRIQDRGIDLVQCQGWERLTANADALPSKMPAPLEDLQRILLDDVGDDVTHGVAAVPSGESLTVGGKTVALPLSPADAEALFSDVCKPSAMAGIRGVAGPQYETHECRKFREAPVVCIDGATGAASGDSAADVVALPPSYGGTATRRSVFGRASEAAQRIHTTLCPDAAALEVVPEKIIATTAGDFLGPHVDVVSPSGGHFGTLLVHLPTQEDYALSGCEEFRPAVEADRRAEIDAIEPDEERSYEECPLDTIEATYESGLPRRGGSFVFYSGRPVGADNTDREARQARGFHESPLVGLPHNGFPDLVPPHAEVGFGSRELGPLADKAAEAYLTAINPTYMNSMFDAGLSTVGERDALELRLNLSSYPARSFPPSPQRPVNWVAWCADVVYEVTPLAAAVHAPKYRFAVVYKLIRHGSAPLRLPLRPKIEAALHSALQCVSGISVDEAVAALKQPGAQEDGDDDRRKYAGGSDDESVASDDVVAAAAAAKISGVAFVLRHTYTVEGLTPSALRGLDAVLYDVCRSLSPDVGCFLCPVLLSGRDLQFLPFHVTGRPPVRSAYAVRSVHDEHFVKSLRLCYCEHDPSLELSSSGDGLWRHLPAVTDVAWVQLGHGTVIEKSHKTSDDWSLESWADKCTWWTFSFALVVSPRIPTPWRAGHRWVALAAAKGSAPWRRCLQEAVTARLVMRFIA